MKILQLEFRVSVFLGRGTNTGFKKAILIFIYLFFFNFKACDLDNGQDYDSKHLTPNV